MLIPGKNDSDEELYRLSKWVATELGADVPLHFTAFHPDYKLDDVPPTPAARVVHPVGPTMVSWSKVTSPVAPLPANNRLVTVVPVAPTRVMDADAKMVPTNAVAECSGAELPPVP